MPAVTFNATVELALNYIGIFVFAISGALLAVHKNYDIVGMTVLAEITAIGGGVLRDLILGATPPASFTDSVTFLLPLVAAALTFFIHQRMGRIQAAVLVFDAAGLALFCVTGTTKALAYHMGPVEAIALGALTAVGGGIMRDVLANEQPAVLRADSELYAVPAVLGAALVVILQRFTLYNPVTAAITIALVFALRMAALRYGWRAPHPRQRTPNPSAPSAGA
ncbi:MAG TPA: trimeric intracellular cation channel family protein [Ktedonobacterales bacterium]